MRQLRRFHLYLGILFAPAILFFAFSGMLQTFDFHEVENGVAPPKWIAVIAAVHKKQNFPKPRPAAAKPANAPPRAPARDKAPVAPAAAAHSPFALKVFVGLMSIGLMLSALLGIAIALNNKVTRRMSIVMLLLGTILPIALLIF
ncbi:MAG: hypothetical protein B7Y45_07265 [Sphingomonas sp. 28-66-16]|nr:MAG: hypothetical protein B7Y45_07265 [Sphingomonas sp. 28-66-16]